MRRKGQEGRGIRRKNLRLDQRKLTTVRELLGAATETETVERALDLVVFRREVVRGLKRMAGRGGVRDIYADGQRCATTSGC